MRNNKQLGILLMIVSTFCFAAMSVVVKLSGGRIPLMEQVFVRNAVSLVIAIVLVRKRHVSYFGELRFQPYLFGRSFFGFLGVIALFYASNHAAQADVSILSKMSPFVTTLLAFLFLKEKISKVQIAALIIAFVGAFIVANPSFNSNVWPLVVAFLCALCSADQCALYVCGGQRGSADTAKRVHQTDGCAEHWINHHKSLPCIARMFRMHMIHFSYDALQLHKR